MSRVEIEHSFEGTTASFAKDDVVVRGIVKAAGFRFSRNIDGGAWYLNSRWAEPTRRQRVRQVMAQFEADEVELIDGGQAPQTSAAEREEIAKAKAADRAERQGERAERLAGQSDARWNAYKAIGEHIPLGQPILVGHHSERRHRKAIEKMDGHVRASIELDREAQAAARSAATAARAADGASPLTRLRRIERKSAELRDVERRIAKSGSGEYRDRMEALRDTLADEIAHDRKMIEESGRKVYTKADIAKGDTVVVRGIAYKVVRVNAKSVSVPSYVGNGAWTDTVPYHEITKVTKADAA